MTEKNRQTPKGSEIPIRDWLQQIGAKDIQYLGDGDGPPDFVVRFSDQEIAVEVTLLHDPKGWGKTREIAFERELNALIEQVAREDAHAPRWHVVCEYDPVEPRPPRSTCRQWKANVRQALRTRGPGQELQLLCPEKKRGRGIRLLLIPAGNAGGLAPVQVDEGFMVMPTLTEQVLACISRKTDKLQRGFRSDHYDRWWLVFDDEILIAPMAAIGKGERSQIETSVRQCHDNESWSKIVLVNRFQPSRDSATFPKSFHPLWEDPKHPALPRCG